MVARGTRTAARPDAVVRGRRAAAGSMRAAAARGSRVTPGPAAAIAVTLLVAGIAALPTAPATVVAPAAASVTAGGPPAALPAASSADDPPFAGLQPPPLLAAAPSGTRPGPAPGLRAPDRCTPPPAGTTPTSAASSAERLQLAAAHRLATGAGQVVAVIDTGVSPHPRLGSRLRGGGDYLTGGSGLADCDGHGTAVAGIIAASAVGRGSGSGGVEGIAPAAQILAIRQSSPSFEVAGPDGTPRAAGDVRTLAEAIVLAVRSGATVINISEAVCLRARQAAAQGAQVQAALRLAARSDVVVVAAAGNVGVGSCAPAGQEQADQVAIPGWYGDDILTVGAVGPDDAPATFTVPGPWVDVAAPGSGLRSLAVGGGTTGDDLDGTSFAAPWVAGLAALLRERFPTLTAAQVVDRIVATARRAPGGRSALQVGRGVVDPLAALTAVPDVLLSPEPPRAASAPLAGTTARPEAPPPDSPFAPVAGAAVIVGCLAAAASRLRRPPRA
jgi:membrane-anchored mycosin MYCP